MHYNFKYKGFPLINRGTSESPNYIPAERCWVAFGQPVRMDLDENQIRKLMIPFACRRPYRNARDICENGFRMLNLGPGNRLLSEMGISVGRNLVTVEGHLLTAPRLDYRSGSTTVTNGAWNMDSNKVFASCSQSKTWAWVTLKQEPTQTEFSTAGINKFREILGTMGMSLREYKVSEREVSSDGDSSDTCLMKLSEKLSELKHSGVHLVIIIFQERQPAPFYNRVKFLGDVVHGVHTSCLVASKFGGFKLNAKTNKQEYAASPDYFANVALKVNLKLGGKNHELVREGAQSLLPTAKPLRAMPAIGSTMVVGYDVIHPTGPESEHMQSQVGFVASIDQGELSQWQGCYWSQLARTEMLDDNLSHAFHQTVLRWGGKPSLLPQNIVIFRDGVSESQFQTVLDKELNLIQETCKTIAREANSKLSSWSPKITLVVSIKRHSTRFYPTDAMSMNEKTRNIRAGTVVDRSVTQARFWEFFLTAQDAIKGTARPVRYVVLHDDIFRPKFKQLAATKLEELTHKLCYMFGRATKAVRLCTPAYYADILCTRARAYETVSKDKTFTPLLDAIIKGYRTRLEERNKELHEKNKLTISEISAEEERMRQRSKSCENHEDIKESMFWI